MPKWKANGWRRREGNAGRGQERRPVARARRAGRQPPVELHPRRRPQRPPRKRPLRRAGRRRLSAVPATARPFCSGARYNGGDCDPAMDDQRQVGFDRSGHAGPVSQRLRTAPRGIAGPARACSTAATALLLSPRLPGPDRPAQDRRTGRGQLVSVLGTVEEVDLADRGQRPLDLRRAPAAGRRLPAGHLVQPALFARQIPPRPDRAAFRPRQAPRPTLGNGPSAGRDRSKPTRGPPAGQLLAVYPLTEGLAAASRAPAGASAVLDACAGPARRGLSRPTTWQRTTCWPHRSRPWPKFTPQPSRERSRAGPAAVRLPGAAHPATGAGAASGSSSARRAAPAAGGRRPRSTPASAGGSPSS